jgi:hypothetical protein
MPKVKITSVPPGGAPLEIKQAWVGLELPLEEIREPGVMRSVSGGKPDPKSFGGFPVRTTDAIQALRDAGKKKAADWWQNWFEGSGGTGRTLVFAATCGEFVTSDAIDVEAKPVEETLALPKPRAAAMTAANKRT